MTTARRGEESCDGPCEFRDESPDSCDGEFSRRAAVRVQLPRE